MRYRRRPIEEIHADLATLNPNIGRHNENPDGPASHDKLGNTGEKTGIWLEEFAAPYYVFHDASAEVTVASPKGGKPPIDPKSDKSENQTEAMARFKSDPATQKIFATTVKLADVKAVDFDTVFYPGGHGPMWDLANDPVSIALIEAFYNSGKPVAAICHAPAALHKVTYQGEPIVKGKRVTGFTNTEEEAMHLTNVVPFLVEDELKRLGGKYEKVGDWKSFAITDGRLITGQNPASSTAAARQLLTRAWLKPDNEEWDLPIEAIRNRKEKGVTNFPESQATTRPSSSISARIG